jgi:hypothetical protein
MADVAPVVEQPAAAPEAAAPLAESLPVHVRGPKRAPASSAQPSAAGIYVLRVPRPPPDESALNAGDEAAKRLAAADAKLATAVAALAAAQARARHLATAAAGATRGGTRVVWLPARGMNVERRGLRATARHAFAHLPVRLLALPPRSGADSPLGRTRALRRAWRSRPCATRFARRRRSCVAAPTHFACTPPSSASSTTR